MKFSKAKIQECVEWVEENGLYPQRCGASIKQFCEAMGIDFRTYQRWSENANFASAISRAREVFQQRTVQEVSNALVKAAKGYEFVKTKTEGKPQVVTEYDPKTGKSYMFPSEDVIHVRTWYSLDGITGQPVRKIRPTHFIADRTPFVGTGRLAVSHIDDIG